MGQRVNGSMIGFAIDPLTRSAADGRILPQPVSGTLCASPAPERCLRVPARGKIGSADAAESGLREGRETMVNVQSVGAPTDLQPEVGAERANGTRRNFILCSRHLDDRRDWINMEEGPEKMEAHHHLFQAVVFCPECQELSWSTQLPPQPQPEPAQGQAQDTYSWWRDVMGQP